LICNGSPIAPSVSLEHGLSSELTDVFTTLEGYDDGAIEAPVRIESRVRRR